MVIWSIGDYSLVHKFRIYFMWESGNRHMYKDRSQGIRLCDGKIYTSTVYTNLFQDQPYTTMTMRWPLKN